MTQLLADASVIRGEDGLLVIEWHSEGDVLLMSRELFTRAVDVENTLTAERDLARDVAVTLEQELAEWRACLQVAIESLDDGMDPVNVAVGFLNGLILWRRGVESLLECECWLCHDTGITCEWCENCIVQNRAKAELRETLAAEAAITEGGAT